MLQWFFCPARLGNDLFDGDECLNGLVTDGPNSSFLVEDGLGMSLVGATRDDAAGEAFDKVAKMLGLPYPGGPEVDRAAASGRPDAIDFPRPVLDKAYDFSFSGLKTAVRYFIDDQKGKISPELASDIAASFQEAVVDVLVFAVHVSSTLVHFSPRCRVNEVTVIVVVRC